ncbi:kinase-like domain-containing protein [Pisolithus albus]|nr:kinase-like domain-containing protein [Pisolithus albus]
MHAHLVAHMDIKPENIVIPRDGGDLSIIDFSVAVRLKSDKEERRGVIGTPGYTAPEVERGDAYKPIQADLWSCGRTLEVLCSDCKPSFDRSFLLRVAAELMNEDPDQRPTMSTVQEWIASKKVTLSAETRGFRYPSSHLVACV